jgi:hypothetical protein
MCVLAQLVKCSRTIHKEMGLNLAGNIRFFSVCVTKLSSMVFCQYFFENYRNIGIWTIGTHFLKTIELLEYQILGRQVRKTIGLSDIRYQTQMIRLSDI